jgi:hypothetical protein
VACCHWRPQPNAGTLADERSLAPANKALGEQGALAHRKVIARAPESTELTVTNEGSQLSQSAEFYRLEHLVYASIALSWVLMAVGLGCGIYFARRLQSNRKIMQLYPVSTRLRVAFAVHDRWEGRVAQAHIEPLRAHRRNARYWFAAIALWFVMHSGVRAVRNQWLGRLNAMAGQAVAKTR